ncbi:MAG: ABC transporter substrate-binding protein [Flavobacteriaceae bacterium]|nr:ABC transporter substrate-binding protein [Flavobacteriaceae bacterium]
MKFTDQLNRTLTFEVVPKRIVSLVPSQTELLVDLGLEDNIVGLTKFCVHPIHLRKAKTIVGGTKQVHYEKIKALRPDVILCNKEENTKEMVVELEKIAPVHVSDIYTIDDTIVLIKQYGELFSVQEKATEITNKLSELVFEFKEYLTNKTTKKVAYFIWRNPWMVAGSNTIIHHLLSLNKLENVFADVSRYPEVDIKSLIGKNKPDFVFLSSEPYPFKDKHIEELQEILPEANILLVDGEYFSWYGTRLLGAFSYYKSLHDIIHSKG